MNLEASSAAHQNQPIDKTKYNENSGEHRTRKCCAKTANGNCPNWAKPFSSVCGITSHWSQSGIPAPQPPQPQVQQQPAQQQQQPAIVPQPRPTPTAASTPAPTNINALTSPAPVPAILPAQTGLTFSWALSFQLGFSESATRFISPRSEVPGISIPIAISHRENSTRFPPDSRLSGSPANLPGLAPRRAEPSLGSSICVYFAQLWCIAIYYFI